MKKVIRDDMNLPLGYAELSTKRGVVVELVDTAGYAKTGIVAETLQSLDFGEREYIEELGELKK